MSGSFWRRKSGHLAFGGGTGGGDDGTSLETDMNGNGNGSVAGTSGNETSFDDDAERKGVTTTPVPGTDGGGGILRVKKRKSLTFWQRKSNADSLEQQQQYNNNNNNTGANGGIAVAAGGAHDVSAAAKTNGTYEIDAGPQQTNGQHHQQYMNGHYHPLSNGTHTDADVNGGGDVVMSGVDDHDEQYMEYGNHNGTTATNNGGITTMTNPSATDKPLPLLQRRRSISPPPQLPAFIGGGEGLGLETERMFQDF